MSKKMDLEAVSEFIKKQGPNTKIYIGCDSERIRRDEAWQVDYTLAIVVHIDGRHGCKIFGEVHTEKDFDRRADRPSIRLMTEVYKIAELYLKLGEVLQDRDVEVHLDINPNENHVSSVVLSQAVGYIRGMCNVIPLVKPKAFAASYAADRFKSLRTG